MVVVTDPKEWHTAIVRAVTEIEAEATTNHTAEQVITALENAVLAGTHIVILVVDTLTGNPPQESVCGMCSLQFSKDHVGNKIALINDGWCAPGYNGKPYTLVTPFLERLAREEGCSTMRVVTCRSEGPAGRILEKFGFEKVGAIFDRFLVNK